MTVLKRLCMKTVTSAQMQEIDRRAQEEFGIPSLTLMENAGIVSASIAKEILSTMSSPRKRGSIAVFCGKGNNGGDGLVISRKLTEDGFEVTTYLLSEESTLKKDPAINLKALEKLGAKIITLNSEKDFPSKKDLKNCGLIVDAVFGTGFKGSPRGLVGAIIRRINGSRKKVLSVDVPSGLDATTGECGGNCVKATETITFGLAKTGFYQKDGPKFTGKITVKNIGFPESLLNTLSS